jgi:hypothetical protein
VIPPSSAKLLNGKPINRGKHSIKEHQLGRSVFGISIPNEISVLRLHILLIWVPPHKEDFGGITVNSFSKMGSNSYIEVERMWLTYINFRQTTTFWRSPF